MNKWRSYFAKKKIQYLKIETIKDPGVCLLKTRKRSSTRAIKTKEKIADLRQKIVAKRCSTNRPVSEHVPHFYQKKKKKNLNPVDLESGVKLKIRK